MKLLQLPRLIRRSAASPQERRKEPRYAPVIDQARIGWWEGEQFRIAAARLRNISNGGAALTVAGEAPPAPPVWISVITRGEKDWILARVAGVSKTGEGAHCVRLAFVEPCPKNIFDAAVSGGAPALAPQKASAVTRRSEPPTWFRRRRRDTPCRHGAWGGPVQPIVLDGEKPKWSGLFEHLKYF